MARQNKKTILLVCVSIVCILFLMVAVCAKGHDYYDTDDPQACHDITQNNACGVWTHDACRVGTYKNGQCVPKGNVLSSVSLLCAITIFLGLIFLCFQPPIRN